MKKIFLLAIVLFAFASCSADTNEPIIEKVVIHTDYAFSHATDSGDVYVSDIYQDNPEDIQCPNCYGSSWTILERNPLHIRCNICNTEVIFP